MIYLDNSSTTKPLPRVAASCAKAMEETFGNPSSLHRLGLDAEKALKAAKLSILATLGAGTGKLSKDELSTLKTLYFTSGGTEADNTALFGMAEAGKRRGSHLITTAVEHPAVLETVKALTARGFRVTVLPVDRFGLISKKDLEAALSEDTVGVSVMAVNNELGTVYPVADFAKLVHEKTDALFHTDAVQAWGKIDLSLGASEIDLASISGHKIHGPKGIGCLYVREGVHLPPFVYGGGQEFNFRSGTENMVGIMGIGEAARELLERGQEKADRMRRVRAYLRDGLLAEIPDITINGPFFTLGEAIPAADSPETLRSLITSQIGDTENAVLKIDDAERGAAIACPSVLNVSFLGCRGEVLLHTLEQKEIYVSTGSACASNSKKKGSHVLQAAGLSAEQIEGAIRFSFCGDNTVEEMDVVISELKTAVMSMRRLMRRK